jgi:uncharacterized protein YndB with AHSA1/START domain
MTQPQHHLTIVRVFDATPEEVYAAWTELPTMRRWFGHLVEADVRIGGRYRVENPSGNGSNFAHVGEFQILEPGKHIRMSFMFAGSEGSGFTDEFIELTFRPLPGGRTEMTFTNAWNGKGMDNEEQGALREGWTQWLDQLSRALTGPDVVALY